VVGATPYAEGLGAGAARDYHPLYPYGWGLRTHASR
jgi:hypothetical protein